MFIFSSVGQSMPFPDNVCWVSWSVLEINIEGVQVAFREISLFFSYFLLNFVLLKYLSAFPRHHLNPCFTVPDEGHTDWNIIIE